MLHAIFQQTNINKIKQQQLHVYNVPEAVEASVCERPLNREKEELRAQRDGAALLLEESGQGYGVNER